MMDINRTKFAFLSVVTAPDWSVNGPSLLDEHMYGSDAFFTLAVMVDDKDSSRYITKVSDYCATVITIFITVLTFLSRYPH